MCVSWSWKGLFTETLFNRHLVDTDFTWGLRRYCGYKLCVQKVKDGTPKRISKNNSIKHLQKRFWCDEFSILLPPLLLLLSKKYIHQYKSTFFSSLLCLLLKSTFIKKKVHFLTKICAYMPGVPLLPLYILVNMKGKDKIPHCVLV